MKLSGAMTPVNLYLSTNGGLKIIVADEDSNNDNALSYSIPVVTWSVDQNFAMFRQTFRTLDGTGPALTRGNTHADVNVGIAAGFDIGNVFREISVLRGDVDGRDETGVYAQLAASIGYGDNGVAGAALDRIRLAGATNLDPTLQQHKGVQLTTKIGEWTVNGQGGSGTQTSINKAAVVGARHVCTSISIGLNASAVTTGGSFQVVLRDGATGVGTIIWGTRIGISATAHDSRFIGLSGLNFPGSVNTAMTLEFNAAGPANVLQALTLGGYTISD